MYLPDFSAIDRVSNWQFYPLWDSHLARGGPYAFLGLPKVRATSALDGVPLADLLEQLKCGVVAVDLRSGRVAPLCEFR